MKQIFLTSSLLLAFLLSCNNDSNVGVNDESSDFTGRDLVVSAPLSKEESLALFISQRGSQLSADEVRDKISKEWKYMIY
jgi:hypothetical protein